MDRFIRRAVIPSLTVTAAFTVLNLFAGTATSTPADLDDLIARIRTESSDQARRDEAQDLALRISQIVDEGQSAAIGDDTIAALVALLEDDNEAGDFWVAGALGLIGPRASRAVPVLEELHPKACAKLLALSFTSGVHYVDAIEGALERISGAAPDCRGLRPVQH